MRRRQYGYIRRCRHIIAVQENQAVQEYQAIQEYHGRFRWGEALGFQGPYSLRHVLLLVANWRYIASVNYYNSNNTYMIYIPCTVYIILEARKITRKSPLQNTHGRKSPLQNFQNPHYKIWDSPTTAQISFDSCFPHTGEG